MQRCVYAVVCFVAVGSVYGILWALERSLQHTPLIARPTTHVQLRSVSHTTTAPYSTLPSLNGVLVVRIYASDKAKWARPELAQWLYYMHFSGVSTLYLYDCRQSSNESLEEWISQFSWVVYHDWVAHSKPYGMFKTQVSAYQHAIDNYGRESEWQIAFDMDEYPFSPADIEFNFLRRAIRRLGHPHIAELSLKNFLFLGNSTTGPPEEWVLERIVRRTPRPANRLDKPIYRPTQVRAGIHHNTILSGRSVDVDPSVLRMNHYWGQRLENWGQPCRTTKGCLSFADMVNKTIFDDSARSIPALVRVML